MTMHGIRIFFGTAFALALTGVSVLCCARFGLRLAPGLDGQIYAGLGAVADCLKSLLPIGITAAFEARHRARAFMGIALFLIFSTYSFTSEIGLYSMARDAQRGTADASKESYAFLKSERDRLAGRLKEIGAVRPSGTIRAEIAGVKQDRQWELTAECKEAATQAGRNFCQAFERRQGELAAAEESERLRADDGKLAAKMESVDLAKVMTSTDAQSEALGRFTGLSPSTVRDAIALLVAALIELGSGFGLWVITARAPHKEPAGGAGKPEETAPGADPVRLFLDNCAIHRPGEEIASADLYRAFADWSQREGVPGLSPTAFGKRCTMIGLTRSKRGGTVRYVDIGLAPGVRTN